MENNNKNKNGAAAVLSFFIPGLGQLYKGQIGSAFFGFTVTMIGYFCLVIPGICMHIYTVIDALKSKTN